MTRKMKTCHFRKVHNSEPDFLMCFEWREYSEVDAYGQPCQPHEKTWGYVYWCGEGTATKVVVHFRDLDGELSVNRHFAKPSDLIPVGEKGIPVSDSSFRLSDMDYWPFSYPTESMWRAAR